MSQNQENTSQPDATSGATAAPAPSGVWSARRDPSKTREATRAAALEILKTGKWPSPSLVRARAKRGSLKDIGNYLEEFFVDVGRVMGPLAPGGEILRAGGLPSNVVAAVYRLLEALRSESTDRLERELAFANRRAADAEQRVVEGDRRRQIVEAERQALDRELGLLKEMRLQLERQIEERIGERKRLEQKVAVLTRKYDLLLSRRLRKKLKTRKSRSRDEGRTRSKRASARKRGKRTKPGR